MSTASAKALLNASVNGKKGAKIRANVKTPQSWKIRANAKSKRKKGEAPSPYFEAVTQHPGVKVCFAHYVSSTSGNGLELRRPYACYFSSVEWEKWARKAYEEIAREIIARIHKRNPTDRVSVSQLDALIEAIEGSLR